MEKGQPIHGKKKPGRPSTGRTVVKPSEWAVVIQDKIPGYITWEQFEKNQKQITSNNKIYGMGTAREGTSLLSGLINCGHCGLRMMTAYTDNGNRPRYDCSRMSIDYGEPKCQSLSGKRLDDLVIKQVLAALQPGALEISLKVAEDIEQERKNLLTNWNHQLERARYQVERTYRQYNAAEPENRLVARTLEKQWEEALLAEEKLKK